MEQLDSANYSLVTSVYILGKHVKGIVSELLRGRLDHWDPTSVHLE